MVVRFTISLGILIILTNCILIFLSNYTYCYSVMSLTLVLYSLTHAILSLCLKMIARVVIETLQIKFLLSTVTVQDLLPEFVQYSTVTWPSWSWKTLACNKIVMQPHYQEIPHNFMLTVHCKSPYSNYLSWASDLTDKSYSIDLFTTTHQQNWFWNCMTDGERTVWGDWCKTMNKVVWPFVNYMCTTCTYTPLVQDCTQN